MPYLNLTKDFWTVEQLADRWGIDVLDVQQLFVTGQLPQAFLLCGPARVRSTAAAPRPLHPLTDTSVSRAAILVSDRRSAGGVLNWPLAAIERVYNFFVSDIDRCDEFSEICRAERLQPQGCRIEFDAGTQVIGRDLMSEARAAFCEATLVSTAALLQYERHHELVPQSDEDQAASRQLRDARKQRCRVAAQILWEKDPTATIPELHRHDWLQRIACNGRPPTEKTLREWVKDLNPNRAPGRRPA